MEEKRTARISNPSQGFNPPFFVTQVFSTPCGLADANPASANDCTIPGFSVLSQGFPSNSLTDPNTPQLFTLDPKLVTPYMDQWHLSTQYQLPSETLFEVTYAGSKGTKLYAFLNGNQVAPSAVPGADFASRRPIPAINAAISLFNSTANSEYNSLQVRAEKRFSKGSRFWPRTPGAIRSTRLRTPTLEPRTTTVTAGPLIRSGNTETLTSISGTVLL